MWSEHRHGAADTKFGEGSGDLRNTLDGGCDKGLSNVLGGFYPLIMFGVACVVCGRAGKSPCRNCITEIEVAEPFRCPEGLDSCVAALSYQGVGRRLITELKYNNQRASLAWLSAAVAQRVTAEVTVVTWVPTSNARRRDRGFDQAELLARRVARRLELPARRALRSRAKGAQTGRTATERYRHRGYSARRQSRERFLLVDDVITTGATLSAAAEALRSAGAVSVHGALIAYTAPDRRRIQESGVD